MENLLSHLKILIVEDQPEARVLLRRMLEDMGVMEVFEASDGKSGLQFIGYKTKSVDLILCDWNMPSMSGLDFLSGMRSTGGSIPFLMVTGRVDKHSVVEAMGQGVDGYIRKPYSAAQLETRLRIMAQRLKVAQNPQNFQA